MIAVDHDGFAVDDAGLPRQAATIRGNVAARQDAKAVVLDLVDPVGTGRWLFRRFWQPGLDDFMREDGAGTWALGTGA